MKEADVIKIFPLPIAGAFRPWRLSHLTEVQAASGCADEAFAWLTEVERLPAVAVQDLYYL